ncbi:hypothetical protein DFH06DRAFT_1129777 [Mycena polygramma]|nr:hypothetical protein DFH06DRAFT_1129777 [Mycena polygramma]
MDRFYPIGVALEELASSSRQSLKARGSLNIQHLAETEVFWIPGCETQLNQSQVDELVVREGGHTTKSWVLCAPATEEDVVDEVVFRIQGALLKNDLVPKNLQFCTDRRFKHLNQYVQICGLHTPTFEDSVAKMKSVHQRFAQHLSSATFNSLTEEEGPKGLIFAASNRLFTPRDQVPTEQDTEFQYGLDPLGTLTRRKTNDLLHTTANMVKYFKLLSGENETNRRYVETVPGAFTPGDLVELQISFVTVTTMLKKIKVTTRLQAITLLNDKFTKESAVLRASATTRPLNNVAIRRKIGYFYEDEEDESKRMRKCPNMGEADNE